MSNAFWGGAMLGQALMERWQKHRRRARERQAEATLPRPPAGGRAVLPPGWAWCAGCGTRFPLQELRPLVQGGPWFCPTCITGAHAQRGGQP